MTVIFVGPPRQLGPSGTSALSRCASLALLFGRAHQSLRAGRRAVTLTSGENIVRTLVPSRSVPTHPR
jgi:hypothetical protein